MKYESFCIYRVVSIKKEGKRKRIKEFSNLSEDNHYFNEEKKKGKRVDMITLNF